MTRAIQLVQSTKTGRRYVATDALLARADMRAVLDIEHDVETVRVKSSPEPTNEPTGDENTNDDTTNTANTGDEGGDERNDNPTGDENDQDDDDQTGGDAVDFSQYSDDDLLAMAKAEPYKLKVSKNMNRETVEKKLIAAMEG